MANLKCMKLIVSWVRDNKFFLLGISTLYFEPNDVQNLDFSVNSCLGKKKQE